MGKISFVNRKVTREEGMVGLVDSIIQGEDHFEILLPNLVPLILPMEGRWTRGLRTTIGGTYTSVGRGFNLPPSEKLSG